MTEPNDLLQQIAWSAPAMRDDLEAAESALGVTIPADLSRILLDRGSGEGFVGDAYLRIWPVAEWPEHQGESRAGVVVFGSDGSNSVFGFLPPGNEYIRFERVGEIEPRAIGSSFAEFIRAVAEEGSA